MNIGSELLNAPFPELVKNMGLGIAEAQFALDKSSIRIAQQMAGLKEDASGKLVKDDSGFIKLQENKPEMSLLSLGFTPTFYQFVDTIIELKIDIKMMQSTEKGISASIEGKARTPFVSFSASVNASYSQKYQYDASGSSSMKTKLVTVPIPVIFEQRLKAIVQEKLIDEATSA
jgi:hypothetical protein